MTGAGPSAPRPAECVVVGAGPAGLAAARTAASHGVRVTLVDDGPAPGRSWRQGPGGGGGEGEPLAEELRARGVDLRPGTVAWGIFDGHTVALASAEQSERLHARTLILAPGAQDRPVPFPGWTLPGVLTLGAARTLVETYAVLPGRRVLVAGSGPLLPEVACGLLAGGAEVVAVCEAAPMRARWRHALRLLPHLDVARRSARLRRQLHAAGVPFLTSHVIRRALGPDEVTGAVVSACDADGRPVAETERRLEVDALVLGYGWLPSSELARLAGCEHRYAAEVDAWLPVRTRDLESTVPGVFVVGAAAGAPGVAMAVEEGRLAALAVANRLDLLIGRAYERERARARGRLLHLTGLRRATEGFYRSRPGLYDLADDDTVLCRCEDVTRGEARAAVSEGARHVDEVKARTRAGMGRCQGRLCGASLAHLIARQTGRSVAESGVFTPRPPVRPVALGALAEEATRS